MTKYYLWSAEESEDHDVIEEEEQVMNRLGQSIHDTSSIEIRGLRKTFQRNGRPYHAVKSPFFAIKKKSLFALLGPNGAGKTTTINMLTGMLDPTLGEALITTSKGLKSISNSADMAQIR
jgi:ABC-type uncharacterized transport system ATPase subunit